MRNEILETLVEVIKDYYDIKDGDYLDFGSYADNGKWMSIQTIIELIESTDDEY